MTQPHKPRVGITLGDMNGIGPEVVIKALADNRILNSIIPVIYGSSKVLSFYKKLIHTEEFNYTQVRNRGQYGNKGIHVVNAWDENLEAQPGKPSKEAGKAAFAALKQACEDLKENHLDALITAPIDKHSIHSEEFPFKGHTEYLTQFFDAKESLMFMVSPQLRVAVVTEHIPVSEIAKAITPEKVESKVLLMEQSLRKDFGISKPKIAVLGLNPHAGDGGIIGREEEDILKPLITALRSKGKLIFGPYPADGLFGTGQYKRFDGILAMYHDQGLTPFKAIAFEDGVNFTAGLSIVRTSPDHGTAYALAGKNQADESSMRAAIYSAIDILKSRAEMTI
jgi:4-hydroxythreonine-4-phosphate dehydrogenase